MDFVWKYIYDAWNPYIYIHGNEWKLYGGLYDVYIYIMDFIGIGICPAIITNWKFYNAIILPIRDFKNLQNKGT
jgi:hypothetical protein